MNDPPTSIVPCSGTSTPNPHMLRFLDSDTLSNERPTSVSSDATSFVTARSHSSSVDSLSTISEPIHSRSSSATAIDARPNGASQARDLFGDNVWRNSRLDLQFKLASQCVDEPVLSPPQAIINGECDREIAIPVPAFPEQAPPDDTEETGIGLISEFDRLAQSSTTPLVRRIFERLTRALPQDDTRSLSAFSEDEYSESFGLDDPDFFAGMGSVSGSIIGKLGETIIRHLYWLFIWRDMRSLRKAFPHNDEKKFDDMDKIYDLLIDMTWSGAYPNQLRNQALSLLLGQVRTGSTEHLIRRLKRLSYPKLKRFLTKISTSREQKEIFRENPSVASEYHSAAFLRPSYHTHPSILQELQNDWEGSKLPLFAFLCRILLLSQELYMDFASSVGGNAISEDANFLDILLRICIGFRNRRMHNLQTPVDNALGAANATLSFAFSPIALSPITPDTSMLSSHVASSFNSIASSSSSIRPVDMSLIVAERAKASREHFENHPVYNLWPTYAKLGVRTPIELPEKPNVRRCDAWQRFPSHDPIFTMRLRAIGWDCVFLKNHTLYPVPFAEIYDMCMDLIEFARDPPEGRYAPDVRQGARKRLVELLQTVLPLNQDAWPKVRESLRAGKEVRSELQKTSYVAYVQCHLALDKNWGQVHPFHDPLLKLEI